MLGKLREVLLTQYIGAFLIALLVWRSAVEIITTIVRIVISYFRTPPTRSALGFTFDESPFPWTSVIFMAATVALYLLTACALARWLYPVEMKGPQAEEEPSARDREQP